MKTPFLLSFTLLIFLNFPAAAQTGDYEILAIKNVSKPGGKLPEKGQFLHKKDRLLFAPKGLLILQTKAGNLLEISAEGEQEVTNFLTDTLPTGPAAGFVAGQLRNRTDPRSLPRKRFMRKTGVVSCQGMESEVMLMPKMSFFIEKKVFLSWYSKRLAAQEDLRGFQVLVFDMSDEIIKTLPPVESENVLIDLAELGINFKESGPLIFKVVGLRADGSFTEHINVGLNGVAFLPMEDEESGPIREELNAIAPAGPKPSVLQKLVAARFFEEKDLFSDAAAAYRDALELSQNMSVIRRLYDDFLYRNILTKEAYFGMVNALYKKD